MWCVTDNHNDTSHTCAKGFNKLLTKYQIFMKLAQILHIHKNINFLTYNWELIDQLLPYKFHDSST